jgi:predicted ribosome quality control (RQC) complex YloA/Tae2 family protein
MSTSKIEEVSNTDQESITIQPIDYTSLFYLTQEISTLLPAVVDNIMQDDDSNIYINIKSAQSYHWLIISWHRFAARINLTSNPPNDINTKKFSFASTLRSLLKDFIITKLSILKPYERILCLDLHQDNSQPVKYKMIVEIFGARSNIFLVSADNNMIITCAYQVSQSKTSRPLRTSMIYEAPLSGGGLHAPLQENIPDVQVFYEHLKGAEDSLTRRLLTKTKQVPTAPFDAHNNAANHNRVSLVEVLTHAYKGMSPNVATELLMVSDLNPHHILQFDERIETLFTNFQTWCSLLSVSVESDYRRAYVNIFPHFINASHALTTKPRLYSILRFDSLSSDCDSYDPTKQYVSDFLRGYYEAAQRAADFLHTRMKAIKVLSRLQTRALKLMNEFSFKLSEST